VSFTYLAHNLWGYEISNEQAFDDARRIILLALRAIEAAGCELLAKRAR